MPIPFPRHAVAIVTVAAYELAGILMVEALAMPAWAGKLVIAPMLMPHDCRLNLAQGMPVLTSPVVMPLADNQAAPCRYPFKSVTPAPFPYALPFMTMDGIRPRATVYYFHLSFTFFNDRPSKVPKPPQRRRLFPVVQVAQDAPTRRST